MSVERFFLGAVGLIAEGFRRDTGLDIMPEFEPHIRAAAARAAKSRPGQVADEALGMLLRARDRGRGQVVVAPERGDK